MSRLLVGAGVPALAILALTALFLALPGALAAQDEPPTEDERDDPTPGHALSVQYGAGIDAGGSVIDSAGAGLDLLEDLINTGLLYNPLITPGVRSVGPF